MKTVNVNNYVIYLKKILQILYPDNINEISYTKHLKFDFWAINRIN